MCIDRWKHAPLCHLPRSARPPVLVLLRCGFGAPVQASNAACAVAGAAPGCQRRVGWQCMYAAVQRAEEVELGAVAAARTRALEDLDQAISQSLDLLSSASDPAAPEVLAADRVIAANARRALTLMKALQVPLLALVPAQQRAHPSWLWSIP